MVLPDAHIPNHDPGCMDIVVKAAEVVRPDEIVILGDWVDAEAASFHPANSLDEEPQDLQTEYEGVHREMNRIKKAAGGCKFTYIEGNHCARVERVALKLGGALGSSFYRALSPKAAIADARGDTEWVPYVQKQLSYYKIAEDLIAVHGWSYAKHAAAKHAEKAVSVSVVHGHTHRQQSYCTRDPISGRVIKAWSPGSLCANQPFYAHRNGPTEWVWGFSVVYVGRSGDWTDVTSTIKPTSNGGRFAVLDGGREVRV